MDKTKKLVFENLLKECDFFFYNNDDHILQTNN